MRMKAGTIAKRYLKGVFSEFMQGEGGSTYAVVIIWENIWEKKMVIRAQVYLGTYGKTLVDTRFLEE